MHTRKPTNHIIYNWSFKTDGAGFFRNICWLFSVHTTDSSEIAFSPGKYSAEPPSITQIITSKKHK